MTKPTTGGVTCTSLGAHVVQAPKVPPAPDPFQERASKWAVFALAAPGAFMTTLDSSIVNISLPSIARAFGVPLNGAVEWIIIGYLVVIAGVLLTAGRLADMIGRKPIFIGGIIIFTLGSTFSGAAPSLSILIAARCFQGLGGALLFSVNIAMLTHAFPANERGRALGFNSIVVALGVSVGPTLLATGQHTLPPATVGMLQDTFVTSFRAAMLACAALAALGVLTALVRGNEIVKNVSQQH
jgi:MFS family permease